MIKQILTQKSGRLAALIMADGLFFGLTDPLKLPSFMLFPAFVLLAASLYAAFGMTLSVSNVHGPPPKTRRRIAAAFAVLLAGLIALQTIGELGARDIIILVPLAILASMYTSYNREQRTIAS